MTSAPVHKLSIYYRASTEMGFLSKRRILAPVDEQIIDSNSGHKEYMMGELEANDPYFWFLSWLESQSRPS